MKITKIRSLLNFLIILPLWLVCAQTGLATSSENNSSDQSPEQQIISNMTKGTKAWAQSQHEKALEFFQRGLEIAISLKKQDAQIMFLNKMGVVQTTIFSIQGNLDQASKAIEFFQQSLTISREINDRKSQADNLIGLAQVYLLLDQYVPVADYYEQALVIYREINDREGEAAAQLDKLGIAYIALGQYNKALDTLHRALEIHRETGVSQLKRAINLSVLATVYKTLNQLEQALVYYKDALDISQKINERNLEAMCLTQIGNLYQNQKQYQLAIDNHQLALKIQRETRDQFGQAHTLLSLGSIYNLQGQHSQALSKLQESLELYRKIGGRGGEANVLSQLAHTYYRNEQYVQALDYHQQSLEIRQTTGQPHAEAKTLFDIGSFFFHQGQPRQAYDKYSQALGIGIQINTPELLWQSWNGVSEALNRLNQTHAAILAGKQAVNILQGVRSDNLELKQDLQKSYLTNKVYVYHHLANLLIEQGRLPEAQQVLTMLKEEEFYEHIQRDNESNNRTTRASLNSIETAWFQEYQNIADQLASLGTEKQKLNQKKTDRTEADNARLKELDQKLEVASSTFQRTLDKLTTAFEQADPVHAQKQKDLKLENDLTDLMGGLGEGVVLLQTVTMDDGVWLLLTTSKTRKVHKVNVSKKELNQHLYAFREALNMTQFDPREAGQALYNLLIAPLQADLQQANTKVLMASLDGALRYIPLAAMHDGKQYLIEYYALTSFNEAAQDNLRTKPKLNWKVAGLGTSNAHPGFSPLPAVEDELNGIVRQNTTGSKGVLDGVIRLNQDFNPQQLQQVMREEYPVLHIASHFQFKPGTETDSFLLLGDGSRLNLGEIRKGNYSFKEVDLFTLSACNTAVADAGEGKEVEGLSVMAQKKGAKGVLSTLWSVADQSTSLLMQTMYRLHQTNQFNKAEALQQAQLALLRGTATGSDQTPNEQETRATVTPVRIKTYHRDKQRPYAHPYYWAPFVLMGNWL